MIKPAQGRTEAVNLNGLNAARFEGERQNAQGQLQSVEATIVNPDLQLRLINGYCGGGEPRAGQLVKVVDARTQCAGFG